MAGRVVIVAALLVSGIWSVEDKQTRVVALPAERSLQVEITVGDVRVVGEPRNDAAIEIVRHAPTADALARIPVLIQETEEAVVISIVQRDGGTDPAYQSDLILRVPHNARLSSIRIVEGRLSLGDLRGAVKADVRRGPIEARDVQGIVRLETGIGDITADRMRLSVNGLLRLRAFNGNVRLTLAERPPDARIMALALNGHIESEIPLRTKATWGPRWGEATLGSGEPVISLDVITGTIFIKSP